MKTLGIVGGIGPESTIDYYRSVVALYREKAASGGYPSLLINSIDASRMLGFFGADDLESATSYLAAAVESLAAGGAEVALIAANTPHLVFEAIAARSRIPMISIVEVACVRAGTLGLKRLGLFGTRFTMEASFYQTRFARSSMAVIAPEPGERVWIHQTYMTELIAGRFLAQTRSELVAIIAAMKQRQQIDGIILGGTELPLILDEPEYGGVTVLNTTRIHVDAAVEQMLRP